MLDYAANAVAYWPVESLQAHFAALCERNGVDAQERLVEFVRADETDVNAVERFWLTVKTNLEAGRVRLFLSRMFYRRNCDASSSS